MSDSEKNGDAQVLSWSGKLFSGEDLRLHWKGQRELVLLDRTLLTPLALDELKAKGVRITRQNASAGPTSAKPATASSGGGAVWNYGQERPDPAPAAAAAALAREGMTLEVIRPADASLAAWLAAVEGRIRKNAGCVFFCVNAALVCCLANKIAGIRAVVVNAGEARRALTALGANLLAVEMPGRTFFEVRQILKTAAGGTPGCPAEIAQLLGELEAHAHR
jgi:hypothetical protein